MKNRKKKGEEKEEVFVVPMNCSVPRTRRSNLQKDEVNQSWWVHDLTTV
tara:strand:+ start:54 stop:200 length:147 start_codon:yes stop_codon:yes gene_type:complete